MTSQWFAGRRLAAITSTSVAERLLSSPRLARSPIVLFRRGLGWVFAGRLLLLEHVGRKSGCSRFVVLEAIERSPTGVVVAAGFGDRSQWLRNLRANPRCRVSIGFVRNRIAAAEELEGHVREQVLAEYAMRYPRAHAALGTVATEALFVRLRYIDPAG
jgi:deazaflavin-dependent oxidoreductase (nitroreductase family)